MLACYFSHKGKLELLEKLIEKHKLDIKQIFDFEKRTLLHLAACSGNVNVVCFLLAKNCDLSSTDICGRTPLWEALENNHLSIAKRLYLHGAVLCDDPVKLGAELFFYVQTCDIYRLDLLIEFGPENLINMQDYDGRTPLHLSFILKFSLLKNYLNRKGADTQLRDRWGKIPQEYEHEK